MRGSDRHVKGWRVKLTYSAEDKGWIADVPSLPGCSAWGAFVGAALREVAIVIDLWLEANAEMGRPTPAKP